MVKPGKTFLHRLFELLVGTKKDHHHIPLHGHAMSNFASWDLFLELCDAGQMQPEAWVVVLSGNITGFSLCGILLLRVS